MTLFLCRKRVLGQLSLSDCLARRIYQGLSYKSQVYWGRIDG